MPEPNETARNALAGLAQVLLSTPYRKLSGSAILTALEAAGWGVYSRQEVEILRSDVTALQQQLTAAQEEAGSWRRVSERLQGELDSDRIEFARLDGVRIMLVEEREAWKAAANEARTQLAAEQQKVERLTGVLRVVEWRPIHAGINVFEIDGQECPVCRMKRWNGKGRHASDCSLSTALTEALAAPAPQHHERVDGSMCQHIFDCKLCIVCNVCPVGCTATGEVSDAADWSPYNAEQLLYWARLLLVGLRVEYGQFRSDMLAPEPWKNCFESYLEAGKLTPPAPQTPGSPPAAP